MGDIGEEVDDFHLSQLLQPSQALGLATEMEEAVGSCSRYDRFTDIGSVGVFISSYPLVCFRVFLIKFCVL